MAAETITLRPAIDAAEWTALTDVDPAATPFHEWDLVTGVARRSGARFHPMIVRSSGKSVGVVPVVTAGTLGVTPSLFLPYTGPLVPPSLLPQTLAVLRRWQLRNRQTRVRLGFSSLQSGPPTEPGHGIEVLSEPTYVLDLRHRDVDAYLAGMHTDRRANLRRAARRGVISRPSTPGEARALLPRVVSRSFERHDGTVPASVVAVAQYVDAELAKNRSTETPLIAETLLQNDKPVGMLVAARHGISAFGFIGGVLPEALPTNATTVGYDAVIRRAMEAGVERFDFVGHVDDGVARFKRSFGAAEEQCWRLTSTLLPGFVTRARARALSVRSRSSVD